MGAPVPVHFYDFSSEILNDNFLHNTNQVTLNLLI